MESLARDLGKLGQSLVQLQRGLSNLQEAAVTPAPTPASTNTPVQQQIMDESAVKSQSANLQDSTRPGRLDVNRVIPIFEQDMAAHQAENAKIPAKTANLFRVMSYNVHFWAAPGPGRVANYDAMWQVVDQVQPDVLILQEASSRVSTRDQQLPEARSPMVEALNSRDYRYLATCNAFQNTYFGNIVASKIEPTKMRRAAFANQERAGSEDRCWSYMELELANGENVHIYGTHLEIGKAPGFDIDALRDKQVQELSTYIKGNLNNQNVLIAGDFNATRNRAAVKNLETAGFTDSFSKLGWQHPIFTSMFGSEIDFMFLNPGWNLPLAGAYVYWSAASDHLPIIMDIKVN